MTRKNKKYDKDFKLEAAKLVTVLLASKWTVQNNSVRNIYRPYKMFMLQKS